MLARRNFLRASLAIGGISMEAGAIASALTSNRGMTITTRQAAANRQVIYGQQRVGGVMIYESTTGSSHDQYNMVIVIAGHEIESIQNLYLDGRQLGTGVVIDAPIPPGHRTLRVVGQGYQEFDTVLTVVPGQTINLGTITLKDAGAKP